MEGGTPQENEEKDVSNDASEKEKKKKKKKHKHRKRRGSDSEDEEKKTIEKKKSIGYKRFNCRLLCPSSRYR